VHDTVSSVTACGAYSRILVNVGLQMLDDAPVFGYNTNYTPQRAVRTATA
jgi:hypothetical protein